MAGLAPDARVEVAAESGGFLQTLTEEDLPGQAAAGLPGALTATVRVARTGAGDAPAGAWLERTWGREGDASALALFAATLGPLAAGERALCALPFALTVR